MSTNTATTTKAVLAAFFAALGAYCRELVVPVIIVAAVMGCDYLSGVAAAWINGTLSSRVGIIGIVKKIAYALIVVVGIAIDWIVQAAAEKVGIDAGNFFFFALLVSVWLIINECISIIENVARMGVDIPPFLETITKRLKNVTEAKGETSIPEGKPTEKEDDKK